jgi:hypothetical protein
LTAALFISFAHYSCTFVELVQSPSPQPGEGAAALAAAPALGSRKEDYFLDFIRAVESNRGANTNHRPLTSGRHAGTVAVGQWGIMPITAAWLVTLCDVRPLRGYSIYVLQKQMRKHELVLARCYARLILKKAGGDLPTAAYMWYNGHGSTPTLEELTTSPYVDQFLYHLSKGPRYAGR